MNKKKVISFFFIVSLLGTALYMPYQSTPISISYPNHWPEPVYNFKLNPLTKEGVDLGRKLFYDPILSKDSSISCSNCHLSFTAFAHVDHRLSHGINDSIGTRNSPALMNLVWSTHFMWDGGVNHLDVQALAPITHPAEMGEDLADVVTKLQATQHYPLLFKQLYGDSIITGERVLKSISQFELTLISCNSKYDSVMRKETSFTGQEIKGYQLFQQNCASCHSEPLFTNHQFENNGLLPDSMLQDMGRMKITLNPNDSLKFKVPTLRNIEFSYPYMHDGRFKNLTEVLNHYTNGIHSSKTLSEPLQGGIPLNPHEKVDITAFLLTLTDKNFLFNKDFSYPQPFFLTKTKD